MERVHENPHASIQLLRASAFTLEELTAAYNQTRVDYIVPMPMNVKRLHDYIVAYDVRLDVSAVAMEAGQMLGLSMLGVRGDRTWITRLGVLPVRRRRGAGELLMEDHLEQSRQLNARSIQLEVIKNNWPAHRLFRRLGFEETRELLVLRRPPGPPEVMVPPYTMHNLEGEAALALLARRSDHPSWLDETPSLRNAGYSKALHVSLANGDRGWITYQHTPFQLARLVIQPETGDFETVTRALLHALHTTYPNHDTKRENLAAEDPRWPILQEFGYLNTFSRVEMWLDL